MDDSQDTASGRYLRSDLRANISELDARILALENSLAAVRRKREELQSRLDDYKYPVLTLPAEITAEIFISFLPIYPLRAPFTGLLSPELLGRVCRQWRDIAFGTPRLWSAIEIEIDLDIPDLLCPQVDLLQTWLARSKNCPLSLSVQICADSYDYCLSLCQLTDTILMHSARLEYANLLVPFYGLHWAAMQGPFPSLRDLTLGASDFKEPKAAVTAFCDAPTLTTVHLLNFYPSQVELPWSQLTTISVEDWETSQVAHILRNAVSLVNFSGDVWDTGDDVEIMSPLLHLQSLILSEQEGSWGLAIRKLLGALTAPALRHLTISSPTLEPLSFDHITSFITRSQCLLESLHVTRCGHWEEADVRAIFPLIKVVKVFVGFRPQRER
ncbi:hypothetical protein C8J57DRAFT_1731232 [Mycena rebaudengoi]|nr:hypothetical protein C8J57DRAFT_1731232 [Mycena rebaudengoi]